MTVRAYPLEGFHAGRRGFTLIELLVVLGIVAVLAGIGVPVYARVTQGARAAGCVSNLRQIGAGLNLYLGEHNLQMPSLQAGRKHLADPGPVIDDTLNTYVTDPRVFACPADSAGLAAASGTSYYWNVLLNGQSAAALHMLALPTTDSQIPVLSDKGSFHPFLTNKVNLLYADGHADKDFKFVTDSSN